ncbi:glucose-6-phosphate isomerase [Oxalobacter aliiformigenes]|uniref:Glucose-6-phosphate isomerase n=1 Tax=Oxalobacter aliiformigenes TaxID=2946593 RepID=A0ABY7JJ82_9BURK|nr:glucose-6-phosphate isomerase [Oxalobacter aliiformigenes]WAV93145.1 glucose-6-phosphate isomerase [Oxalobacter aliiformigenes]WAV95350.1 glucose-6-phosphate isomerase [Oxalobacter aliiformigenes]WAV96851.1 glucose-6-phosphate isomerase [Oxalobacter aliiformigenes]
MNPTNLANTAVFQKLRKHAEKAGKWSLKELFRNDPGRFPAMTLTAGGLFLDFSKNFLTKETLLLLLELAKECDLEKIRDRMFEGDKINTTEHRAVLHTALRAPRYEKVLVDGKNVIPDIQAVLDQMRRFSEKIHSGEWKGFTGKPITDIVNIGIGGSDVGPRMVCQAMRSFHIKELNVHFVANVDGHDLDMVLNRVRPETTLFIIASKTFTTLETMLNAHSARSWFLNHGTIRDIQKHFIAISTNREAVEKFGIHHDNLFPFWDWVGGRYSVWSAIGLPVVLAIGYNHFTEFLAGAHAMDVHFRYAPLASNMPVLLGLTGIWNRNFLGCTSVSVAPYLQDLVSFPRYLQQLEMESNGKQVQKNGEPVTYGSCPVIWGNVGTNGQHAYFQLLHQGTEIIPVDFIVALSPHHTLAKHHSALLANCFAQSEALMKGKTADQVRADLEASGMSPQEIETQIPQRTFPGNRPSNTILMNVLRPETLGALMALYEHKTFVQGVIWNINSFDQWGVELGKVLAQTIQKELENNISEEHDSSTSGLIALAKASRK